MLTVLLLLEAYPKPAPPPSKWALFKKSLLQVFPEEDHREGVAYSVSEYSVWIVPSGTEEDVDIDEILERGGIRVLERVSQSEAQRCADDIRRKFAAAGMETREEFLCND